MFNEYNPMQYLAISIANNHSQDKETYEGRIQWVKDNIDRLEDLSDTAEEPFQYMKVQHI